MYPLHIGIVILLGGVLLAVIVRHIVYGHLRVAHSLLWVIIALAFMATPVLYALFDSAHTHWNWPTPTSMIVLLGFAFLLILLLRQTVALSNGWRERKKMAQRLALLEKRLADLENAHS